MEEDEGLSTTEIVIIVVASVLVVAIVVALILYCCYKSSKEQLSKPLVQTRQLRVSANSNLGPKDHMA